ncbi:MAG: helix-turn-helix transcriptional regulator [Rhodobacter sp.]|nr:helix-turn-helix transcriptional regulator [Paracoccaceae bacterium]MCC0077174.1 helix-turn-helix transcriptional regulator [Rhodobacter sp.]
MMARNGYNEGCLAAHALDLVGDRWAILVLRELMLGPKRFGAIKAGLPGIATNVLTQRLDDLAAAALLERRTLPPPANVAVYALTPAGQDARLIIDALCLWGVRQPGHDPRKFISPTALMLSMQVMYHAPADAPALTAAFTMGGEIFATRADAEGFHVQPAPDDTAALRLAGPANAMAAVIYGPLPLADSLSTGGVRFDGDPAMGQALIDRFALRR